MSGTVGTYRPTVHLSQPNVLLDVSRLGAGQQDELNLQRNRLLFDTAQRQATADEAFRAAAPGAIAGDQTALAAATAADPERSMQLRQHLDTLDVNARRKASESATLVSQHLGSMLGVPDQQAATLWPSMLEDLKARGVDVSKIPPQYPGRAAVEQGARAAQGLDAQLKAYDAQVIPAGGGDVAQYQPLITAAAQKHGVRPELIAATIGGESAGNPNAVSAKGATGLMQIMPATGRDLGITNPRDPAQSIDGGTAYLAQNIQKYGGNEALGLIAYNWGPGNTDQWIARGAKVEELPAETRSYVNDVLSKAQGGGQPTPLVTRGTGLPVTQGAQPGMAWARGPDGQAVQVAIPGAEERVKLPEGMMRDQAGNLIADPNYIKAKTDIVRATTSAKEQGKPLPDSTRKRLADVGDQASGVTRLLDNFKPDYAGYKGAGTAVNFAGRILGDTPLTSADQSQWWQDYEAYAAVVRHGLYGAALTATEMAAWNRASITPNMDPKQVRENLDRQKKIVDGSIRRHAASLAADGYKPDAIAGALGIDGEDVVSALGDLKAGKFKETNPATAPGAQTGTPPAQGGIAEGATATNRSTGERVVYRNGAWEPVR